MFGKKSVETLVVGAGPTGMMTALILARAGIETAIVDAAESICARSNAIVLHPQTLKLFDQLGFAERIIDAGYRIDKALVYDATQLRETIQFNELPLAFPYAISLPQSALESILEEELAHSGIRILWNHRLTQLEHLDHALKADVDRSSERGTGYAISHTERMVDKTLHFHCKLLVAADGYNSLLRRFSRVQPTTLGPAQYFIFFDFETDMDPQHAMRLSINDKLATALHPMRGGLARLSFQYEGLDLPAENRNKDREPIHTQSSPNELLEDSHLSQLVAQRVPWISGAVNRITYRAIVPFEKTYLKTPNVDRVFFLGDAARSFGPLSATSMNLGLQEAERFVTAYKDSREHHTLAPLARLEQDMISQWRALVDLERLSIPSEMADPWIATNRARILRALPASGESIERLAHQLFLHVRLHQMAEA